MSLQRWRLLAPTAAILLFLWGLAFSFSGEREALVRHVEPPAPASFGTGYRPLGPTSQ